jgi:hypothetical protein
VEYVYANNDGMVLNEASGGTVMMHPGEVWLASDPFVQSRRDLFSSSPTLVHSTTGRLTPPATPMVDEVPVTSAGETRKARARA